MFVGKNVRTRGILVELVEISMFTTNFVQNLQTPTKSDLYGKDTILDDLVATNSFPNKYAMSGSLKMNYVIAEHSAQTLSPPGPDLNIFMVGGSKILLDLWYKCISQLLCWRVFLHGSDFSEIPLQPMRGKYLNRFIKMVIKTNLYVFYCQSIPHIDWCKTVKSVYQQKLLCICFIVIKHCAAFCFL